MRPSRLKANFPGIDIELSKVLHASEAVTVPAPLRPGGSARSVTGFTEIWDKGKAAVIVSETSVTDLDGRPLWSTKRSIFARGEGGCGGERGRQRRSNRRSARPISKCRYRSCRSRPCSIGWVVTATRCTRSRIRCRRRFSVANPARTLHIWHCLQGDRRRGPGRRGRPGVFLRRPFRRRGVPPRNAAGEHLERERQTAGHHHGPCRDDATVLSGVELVPA
jgi:hypothetical protein